IAAKTGLARSSLDSTAPPVRTHGVAMLPCRWGRGGPRIDRTSLMRAALRLGRLALVTCLVAGGTFGALAATSGPTRGASSRPFAPRDRRGAPRHGAGDAWSRGLRRTRARPDTRRWGDRPRDESRRSRGDPS